MTWQSVNPIAYFSYLRYKSIYEKYRVYQKEVKRLKNDSNLKTIKYLVSILF